MKKILTIWCMIGSMGLTVFVTSGRAEICDQHDFGSAGTYSYVYASGKAWDFIAAHDMLVESIETQSVLATLKSGTFHIRIEVNNTIVSVMDQYVSNDMFAPYIQSDSVTINLQEGDKLTYRIYGNFFPSNDGAIQGPNYVRLCGTEGINLSPPAMRDDFLTLVNTIDSPVTYPYGLASDGTYLWLMGQLNSTVYKIDASGNLVDSFSFPCYISPGDLAFDGTYLWATDCINKKIHQISTSGDLIATIVSPANNSSGLACDGRYLWVTSSNTTTNTVYKIDKSGNIIFTFDSPGNGYKGLALDGTYLWHVDATSKILYKFDLEGNVIGSFQLPLEGPSMGPRGLTTDGTFLWYSSYDDNKIYQLAFPREVPTGTSKRQTFEFKVNGAQTVTIDTLSVVNGDGHTFSMENDNCSGVTLSGSASCTFDILFAPLSVGAHTANLRMPINLPETHVINSQLIWTAVEYEPEITRTLPCILLLLLAQ